MSIKMKYLGKLIFLIILVMLTFTCVSVNGQEGRLAAEQWAVFETSFTSSVKYNNAFTEVAVDVIFRHGATIHDVSQCSQWYNCKFAKDG